MAEVIKMKKSSEGVFQSGVTGITWEKNIDTWRASLTVDGRVYALGFNPNYLELIPILEMAKKKKEEGVEAFLDWYKNDLGREIRVVTPAELQSDVAGVSYITKSNKWLAQVSIENRKYVLGTYEIQEDAEAARHEAEKIKTTCENTITDDHIIDYTPLYEHLEKLRIERQQSRLDARIGKGHGRRAWKRLKKEEHALDKLLIKHLKGEIVKELKEYKKVNKESEIQGIEEYPSIKYLKGSYFVFVDDTYVGKTMDVLHAILLYESASNHLKTESWVSFYEEYLQMGTKVPTVDELAEDLELSLDKYRNMKQIMSACNSFVSAGNKETFGNVTVSSRDFRHMPVSEKARVAYMGVSSLVMGKTTIPVEALRVMLEPNEECFLIDGMVRNLYSITDKCNKEIGESNFWHWYLYESGIFATME